MKGPSDHIKNSQIKFYEDNSFCVQGVKEPFVLGSKVLATDSMVPVFNENSTVIIASGVPTDAIKVGDMVAFKDENYSNSTYIIHRVIEVGTDDAGWYAVTKGDTNSYTDGKIRIDQVFGVVVAVIY